jgi:hypothetical protein
MRFLIAWFFYAMGDAGYVVFDQWLPWGMRGPIYSLYRGSMLASLWFQGDGRGPWTEGEPPEGANVSVINGR